MFKRLSILIILLILMIPPSFAAKVGPVSFADGYRAKKQALQLRGAGLKKFLGIQIVAVALYLPKNVPSSEALGAVPKRLEVVYLQNIPKSELDRATIKGIKINTNKQEFNELSPKIDAINAAFEDVKVGDKITVEADATEGMRIYFNQQLKAVVPGYDITRAFFAIWIGVHPVDLPMKKALLGDKK